MTIRRSLTLSFILILCLFGANIAVYYWSNGRRTETLNDLRRASSRASQANAIEQQVGDRQRETSLLAQIAQDVGASRVGAAQVETVRNRVLAIDKRMEQLRLSSEPTVDERISGVTNAYKPLRDTWISIYRHLDESRAAAEAADAAAQAAAVEVKGRSAQAAIPPPPDNGGALLQLTTLAQRSEDMSTSLRDLLTRTQTEESRLVDEATQHSLDVERNTNRVATIMFLTTIMASLYVAWRLMHRVNHGLAALKLGAEKLGAGELQHRIPVDGDDEFGVLGSAFNGMAGKLLTAREEIIAGRDQLKQELAEAASYVYSLLPEPLGGELTSQWRFVPSAQLGGDAFGHEWLDDDHMAVYLLDVCGHGVGSAMLSISVMNVLRSRSLPYVDFRDPGAVLAALNTAFPMETQSDRFFTIWYGVYRKSTRELVYASGGHPPAVLLDDADADSPTVTQLATGGMIVGMMPDLEYATKRHQVNGLAKLYLFSDGIYEVTTSTGEALPFRDFVGLLVESHAKKPSALDATLSNLRLKTKRDSFEDDVSIVEVVFAGDSREDPAIVHRRLS